MVAGEDSSSKDRVWASHIVRAGAYSRSLEDDPEPDQHREHIEPWLSALFQAEHLALLVGSGFTTAIAHGAHANSVDMRPTEFLADRADAVVQAARESAKQLRRDEPNLEDQVRTIIELIAGLRVLSRGSEEGTSAATARQDAAKLLEEWKSELDGTLRSLSEKVLATERGIGAVLSGDADGQKSDKVRRLLGGFLLPFGSRVATRERTHVFTVNYDRLIEYGCDLLGLRVVDRFVGTLRTRVPLVKA